jgi:hypothetical protein
MTNGTALAVPRWELPHSCGGARRSSRAARAELFSSGFTRGILLACAPLENKRTTANPRRDSQVTQPPLIARQFPPRFIAAGRKDSPILRSDECGEP